MRHRAVQRALPDEPPAGCSEVHRSAWWLAKDARSNVRGSILVLQDLLMENDYYWLSQAIVCRSNSANALSNVLLANCLWQLELSYGNPRHRYPYMLAAEMLKHAHIEDPKQRFEVASAEIINFTGDYYPIPTENF